MPQHVWVGHEDKEPKDEEEGEEKKKKKSADTGKIVNLMSGDANRVAMMATAAYLIYVSRCQSNCVRNLPNLYRAPHSK